MDSYSLYANQPVVIDNGSGIIKAGFAGDSIPKHRFPNYVGRPKHLRVMAGALEGDTFIGSKAEEHRGLLSIKYPIEHGIVNDWADMERVWNYIYGVDQLQINRDEHPVLLTEAPLNPRKNKEKTAEIFFESFNVPALYISMQAVLSLYGSGRTTGVVLDSGDGVTHAVPIYEGFALPHSIMRIDLAGRDVTRFLRLLLRKEGFDFHTTAELEIIRQIKEHTCQLSLQGSGGIKDDLDLSTGGGPSSSLVGNVTASVSGKSAAGDSSMAAASSMYQLPDGNIIDIGVAKYRAPEILFRPDLTGNECQGIHEVLFHSIQTADMDLRKILCANIVLSGGSTLFRGFGDRILLELRKLAPTDCKVRISAPQERVYSTWIGGSILASLEAFRKMWVTKKEYESEGARILHKKLF